MEWDKALVSSKVSGVPTSDQNKTFHQMYQEWSSWVNPWLDSNTAPTGATIARCSLSYNGSGAGHEHSSENYIFNNIRQHEIHTDATAAWGVSSSCGEGFLCAPEVVRAYTDTRLNAQNHLSTCGSLLDFWKGYGYGSVNPHSISVLFPNNTQTDYEAKSGIVNSYYDAVNYIASWTLAGFNGAHVTVESYIFNNARHNLTGTSYKNLNTGYQHQYSGTCSACGITKTNYTEGHIHNGVRATSSANCPNQCDLCGYRQGMPGNFSYTESFINGNDNVMTSPAQNATFSDGSSQKIALCSSQGFYIQITLSSETINSATDYNNLINKAKYKNASPRWYPAAYWFYMKGFLPNNSYTDRWGDSTPYYNGKTNMWSCFLNTLLTTFNRSQGAGWIFGASNMNDGEASAHPTISAPYGNGCFFWNETFGPSQYQRLEDGSWGNYAPNSPMVFVRDC